DGLGLREVRGVELFQGFRQAGLGQLAREACGGRLVHTHPAACGCDLAVDAEHDGFPHAALSGDEGGAALRAWPVIERVGEVVDFLLPAHQRGWGGPERRGERGAPVLLSRWWRDRDRHEFSATRLETVRFC